MVTSSGIEVDGVVGGVTTPCRRLTVCDASVVRMPVLAVVGAVCALDFVGANEVPVARSNGMSRGAFTSTMAARPRMALRDCRRSGRRYDLSVCGKRSVSGSRNSGVKAFRGNSSDGPSEMAGCGGTHRSVRRLFVQLWLQEEVDSAPGPHHRHRRRHQHLVLLSESPSTWLWGLAWSSCLQDLM